MAMEYITTILLFVDDSDLRPVNPREKRIKTEGIRLNPIINSSNTI
jgi:hypothetical protein